MNPNDKEISLINIVKQLRNEAESIRKQRTKINRRTKKQAFIKLILRKYNEVIIILNRILSEYIENQKIQLEVEKNYEENVEPNQEKVLRLFKLYDLLRLDIKTLYIWVFHIEDLFKKEYKVDIGLTELSRLSFIRHQFISQHIVETQFFKSSAIFTGGLKVGKNGKIQLLFYDFFSKKDLFVGIKKLVKNCKKYLPVLKNTKNQYEQIDIIYSLRDKLPKKMKRDVNKFIVKSGISTESPSKIALALLSVLKNYRKKARI